jgi:hypothetical protein
MGSMRAACALALAAAVALPAAADESQRPPPTVLATLAGAVTALVPLAVSSALFAASDDDGHRATSVYVMMAGLALAPALSHILVREYKRAAIFAAVPLAALVANVVTLEVDPQATTNGSVETRLTFGFALSFAVVGSVVGLADTLGAGERWRARHPLLIAPAVGNGRVGLSLGGSF